MRTPTIRQQVATHFAAWGIDNDTADYRGAAACRDEDPELFFPLGTGAATEAQIEEAKAICDRCPVAADCLAEAIESGAEGIWGGHTDDERRPLRRAWLQQQTQQQPAEPEPISREEKIANRLCLKCDNPLPATASRDRRWCDGCQRKPAKCGTSGGYHRHMKDKTPLCDPCSAAYNKQRREQYQERQKRLVGAA